MTKARIKLKCLECGISISEEQRDAYRVFACGNPICRPCLPSRKYLKGPCTSCTAEMMRSLPSAASANRTKRRLALEEERAREVELAILIGTY